MLKLRCGACEALQTQSPRQQNEFLEAYVMVTVPSSSFKKLMSSR